MGVFLFDFVSGVHEAVSMSLVLFPSFLFCRAQGASSGTGPSGDVAHPQQVRARDASEHVGVDRVCLDAREDAFKQRIGDCQRAIELLEEGLQRGECCLNIGLLRALQKRIERIHESCMVAHFEHFTPLSWPQNTYSRLTYEKALDIVNNSMWPEFPAKGPALMYACRGPFHSWTRPETLEMASILKAALEIARDEGRFERLERSCRMGQHFFDGGEKTAGHDVCTFWIRKHMSHSGLNWLTNDLHAFFVTWSDLPFKVLSEEMGRHVSQSGMHARAGFHEMLALYLSEDLLNLFMSVGGNYCLNEHSRCFRIGCSLRDEQGLLCCDNEARGGPGTLCSPRCQDLAVRCRQGVRIDDCPAFPVAVPSAPSGSWRSRSRSRSRG